MIRDAAVLKLVVNEAIKESPVISGLRGDISDIKSKLDAHSFAIDSIQGDIRVLRTNYSHQNHEITDVKQDVAILKEDVAILKQDMVFVKERLTYLGVSMEELKHQMHLILDALRPAKDRAAQVDQVFAKVDDHEYRLLRF
jgi:predicted nuclease with TOPRIM domain